jgi:hypothetical protein
MDLQVMDGQFQNELKHSSDIKPAGILSGGSRYVANNTVSVDLGLIARRGTPFARIVEIYGRCSALSMHRAAKVLHK